LFGFQSDQNTCSEFVEPAARRSFYLRNEQGADGDNYSLTDTEMETLWHRAGHKLLPEIEAEIGRLLCVPKIRFCNIRGEGHRELGRT
jgi:hypothetical protein